MTTPCPHCHRNTLAINDTIRWCSHCGTIIQPNSHMVPMVSRPTHRPSSPFVEPTSFATDHTRIKYTSVSLDGNGNSDR